MFMEEATKLRGQGIEEEKKFIEAETLNDFMDEGGSESSKQYDERLPAELEMQKSELVKEDHILKKHLISGNYADKFIPLKDTFDNKKRLHRSIGTLKCEKCDYETLFKDSFRKHILYKHGEREIMCDQCHKKYFTKSHLKEHIEGAHGKGEQCSLCDFKTTRKRNIEKHIAMAHFPKSLLCSECSYTTSDQTMLKTHINRLHIAKEDWPKCSDCDYRSSMTERMNVHFKKVHQHIKFKCTECPSIYSERHNLRTHMRKTHEISLLGDKPGRKNT